MVMFAVSEVELTNFVLLTAILGYRTPFSCQLACDPSSKPEPEICTSSVTVPWRADAGFAAETVGPVAPRANVGTLFGAVIGASADGDWHDCRNAPRANAWVHAIRRRCTAIVPPRSRSTECIERTAF